MSYILDALRRADLERERGSVPGLNAQPAPLPQFGPATPRSARPWVWALVGMLVLLLAALAWYAFGRGSLQSPAPAAASSAQPVRPSTTPAPITAPAPGAAQTDSAASPALAAGTRITAPAPAPTPAPTPAPIPTPPTPAVARPAAANSSVARLPAPPPSRHAAASPKASRSAPKVDANAATVERARTRTAPAAGTDDEASGGLVYTRNQLPEAIRNELPTLSIGGASYSKNPASRMLIINGQVFHEGDTLGPNLTLEQIQLKAAVLAYKGYRYKVSF